MRQTYNHAGVSIYHGKCEDVLRDLPDASVDAIVTDPPYPEINREYGRMTEEEWHAMMRVVVSESRRILKPSGSAVFILQPNSEKVGRMRAWLWEFLAWTAREWNQVQDVWWWNPTTPPTVHCQREHGLMRPSIKACVWLGAPDCYRSQKEVLWTQSQANAAVAREDRALRKFPSGQTMRNGRCSGVADERGGVTPFNLLPVKNSNSTDSGGAHGHGAATPMALCEWWTRYIVPTKGIVLDPFMGSGTTGIAATRHGASYIGIEKHDPYVEMAIARLSSKSLAQGVLF